MTESQLFFENWLSFTDDSCIITIYVYANYKSIDHLKSIVEVTWNATEMLVDGSFQSCLVRNPRERISIAELLEHPYLQLKPQASPEPGMTGLTDTEAASTADWLSLSVSDHPCNQDLQKILTDLAALQSPNSIVRAANVRFIHPKAKFSSCMYLHNYTPLCFS